MKFSTCLFTLFFATGVFSQTVIPNVQNKSKLETHNREATCIMDELDHISKIDLNAKPGDGLAIFTNIEFENGIIEFDVKGKDELQKSFVGIAFHIQDEKTFNAIYFRPFNFKIPERESHSVQYISHPEYTWQKLRTDFPEQFEKKVIPVPDPNDFFHTRVEVQWPLVKVFVENSKTPSLEIKMLSVFNKGKVGFWVGNGSDGEFKNLVVTKQ